MVGYSPSDTHIETILEYVSALQGFTKRLVLYVAGVYLLCQLIHVLSD